MNIAINRGILTALQVEKPYESYKEYIKTNPPQSPASFEQYLAWFRCGCNLENVPGKECGTCTREQTRHGFLAVWRNKFCTCGRCLK